MAKRRARQWVKFPAKKVSRGRLDAFWRSHAKKKRVSKRILPLGPRNRRVVAVSPSVLGTVRKFGNARALNSYLELAGELPAELNKAGKGVFRVQPVQILDVDRKKNRILERVYASPSVQDIFKYLGVRGRKEFAPRYYQRFEARLKRKGIDQQQAKDIILNAASDLKAVLRKIQDSKIEKQVLMHIADNNILVLDIKPKTQEVLFGIVDVTD